MNLIILTDTDQTREHGFRISDHRAEHVRVVLKRGVGDSVSVGILNGPTGSARITRAEPDLVELQCNSWREIVPPTPEIVLICALPRPQTLKKVLLTCAMMGVRSLHLVRANRVEKSYFSSPLVQPENQLPHLIEGLSQGKLTRLPQVQVHDKFRRFFEDELPTLSPDNSASLRLLCSPDTEAPLDKAFSAAASQVVIAIGPEGGWVPFEMELMQSLGFRAFTLGRWTLRVEHAVTAALAQVELLRKMQEA